MKVFQRIVLSTGKHQQDAIGFHKALRRPDTGLHQQGHLRAAQFNCGGAPFNLHCYRDRSLQAYQGLLLMFVCMLPPQSAGGHGFDEEYPRGRKRQCLEIQRKQPPSGVLMASKRYELGMWPPRGVMA